MNWEKERKRRQDDGVNLDGATVSYKPCKGKGRRLPWPLHLEHESRVPMARRRRIMDMSEIGNCGEEE